VNDPGDPSGDGVPSRSVPGATGLHHVSLTVSDLARSVPWYCDVMGFEVIGDQYHDEGRTVVLGLGESDLVLLLQEHKAHEGSSFSEFRPGLDHLSFRVDSRSVLDDWQRRFDDLGIDCQPLRRGDFGAVLIFRDPDRIQLELFADPSAGSEG